MAQAKRKKSTRTAKKPQAARKTGSRANYIVTAMAIIAGVLLCANAAMMMI